MLKEKGCMSTDDELLTPEEVLAGFAARRARLLLFQIESQTASLKVHSQRGVSRYLTEEAAERQDLAFFEAPAQGSQPPVRPTIRDLGRYAPQRQSLPPPIVSLRATLVQLSTSSRIRMMLRIYFHRRQICVPSNE
jgi:hypothetical protein